MSLRRDMPSRALLGVAFLLACAAIAFVAQAFVHRPDNPVEAELLFEAQRVSLGRPLYVDPSVGAWEDGGPPSRFYVLYTPLWPWLVGHLAGPSITSLRHAGRGIATLAWLLAFVVPVVGAARRQRAATAIAALLGLSVYFLARNAPAATPDTLAVAVSCLGFVRIARSGKVDTLSLALVAMAPLVKPSCLGVLAGVTFAHVARRESDRCRVLFGAAAIVSLVGLSFTAISDGGWLTHIVRSTGQPLTWTRFVHELGSRAPILGLPHVVVAAVAIRRRAPLVVTAPLVASVAWASLAMAKHGSGTQYWIEPTMAATVAIAFMPAPSTSSSAPASFGARWTMGALLLGLFVAATSLPAYARELAAWRVHDEELTSIDRHCGRDAGRGEVVVSSDVTVELALDGRILVPDWQSAFLARRGTFPVDAWRGDLGDPRARWLVLPFDPAAPTSIEDTNDTRMEVSAFRDLLRPAVDRHFVRDAQIGGFVIFRRRM